MDGQRIIEVNGVDLCVDTAGDRADPAILLIGGMGASMDWWEEEFCQRLASDQGQGVGHQVPPRPYWTSVMTAMLRRHVGGAGSPSSASSRRPAQRPPRR